jgi:hypothetical protein
MTACSIWVVSICMSWLTLNGSHRPAFEISRVSASGAVLALTPLGGYLAPSTEREPFTGEEYKRSRIPEDGGLGDAKFDDLRRGRTPA